MNRRLTVAIAHHRLAQPFAIARGTREAIDLVRVTIAQDGHIGRGEGAPNIRYGEFADGVRQQIEAIAPLIEKGIDRDELLTAVPPSAARNAIDCAMWDLEAKLSGRPIETRLGPLPEALVTAVTVGIASPDAMAKRARAVVLAHGPYGPPPLLKIKLDANDIEARVVAVRNAAPGAVLIADANESWDIALLEQVLPALTQARVELLEQPLPAGEDEALEGFHSPVPLSADESAHVAADIAQLRRRYDYVTIKLDKSGGLTGALALADAAQAAGMGVMTGCMLCSSLSVAAAWPLAARSHFVDLDGPLWLASDVPGGCRVEQGLLCRPADLGWGLPQINSAV